MKKWELARLRLVHEHDLTLARQEARQIGELLGLSELARGRLATALSEIGRNALEYGDGGTVVYQLGAENGRGWLVVEVADNGPGIPDVDAVLSEDYVSPGGMGIGLKGAKRLMDRFQLTAEPGKGTRVWMAMELPAGTKVGPDVARTVQAGLEKLAPVDLAQEIQRQNQALMEAMAALEEKHEALQQAHRELEERNRGAVALYEELEKRAEKLKEASELKSRFLSYVSHEFRTPLNSVMGLADLLLEESDGPLNAEQRRQVELIQKSMQTLLAMVNDLLDLRKAESGRLDVHPGPVDIAHLFGTLRGMFAPWAEKDGLQISFYVDEGVPEMITDEDKLGQILKNFISNALKFTESGGVTVRATLAPDNSRVLFSVRDTGSGIPRSELDVIFEEFVQLQDRGGRKRVKGTGLGLPITRKLARLLGGEVWAESTVGRGSTFFAELPVQCPVTGTTGVEAQADTQPAAPAPVTGIDQPDTGHPVVLVVEDDEATREQYRSWIKDVPVTWLEAVNLDEARAVLARRRPDMILLDVLLKGESGWDLLRELKDHPDTRSIPVVPVSVLHEENLGMAMGAADYLTKPLRPDSLREVIHCVLGSIEGAEVVIVDDDPTARYVARKLMEQLAFKCLEATGGVEGLSIIRERHPDLVILDYQMPDMDGMEVLVQLRSDPDTADIPVVLSTALDLNGEIVEELRKMAHCLPKQQLNAQGLRNLVRNLVPKDRPPAGKAEKDHD